MSNAGRGLVGAGLLLLAGCGPSVTFVSPATEPAPTNDCLRTDSGFTAGVPFEPVCSGPTCTDDAACAGVIVVAAGDDLQAAAASATSGDCLALEPGDYGSVDLPAGVGLLGRSAADVTVREVTASGDAVLVRGVTVSGGGIAMTGPGSITVDRVAVRMAPGPGVSITDADATLVDVCIDRSGDVGLQIGCTGDCSCPPPLAATVKRTLVSKNASVGAWFEGAAVSIDAAMVVETTPLGFENGQGVYALECASLTGDSFLVGENVGVAALLLGAGGSLTNLTVRGNGGGVDACAVPGAVGLHLSGFTIADNEMVGIAVGGASAGVVLADGTISGTKTAAAPVSTGGVEMVGDGIDWFGGSELVVADSVTISSSGRAPAVIDASSHGSFDAKLSGGDEAIGVWLQHGAAPEIGDGVPQSQPNPPAHVPAYCP